MLCEFDIDPAARFHGEPGDLQELLGNLLENAFKWANRRVLLTAQPLPAPNARRAGLLLAVDDDGPGIAPDDIGKVLQRGVRGDERVQGHGIGLSIVQDLIRITAANWPSAVPANWAAPVSKCACRRGRKPRKR